MIYTKVPAYELVLGDIVRPEGHYEEQFFFDSMVMEVWPTFIVCQRPYLHASTSGFVWKNPGVAAQYSRVAPLIGLERIQYLKSSSQLFTVLSKGEVTVVDHFKLPNLANSQTMSHLQFSPFRPQAKHDDAVEHSPHGLGLPRVVCAACNGKGMIEVRDAHGVVKENCPACSRPKP